MSVYLRVNRSDGRLAARVGTTSQGANWRHVSVSLLTPSVDSFSRKRRNNNNNIKLADNRHYLLWNCCSTIYINRQKYTYPSVIIVIRLPTSSQIIGFTYWRWKLTAPYEIRTQASPSNIGWKSDWLESAGSDQLSYQLPPTEFNWTQLNIMYLVSKLLFQIFFSCGSHKDALFFSWSILY